MLYVGDRSESDIICASFNMLGMILGSCAVNGFKFVCFVAMKN